MEGEKLKFSQFVDLILARLYDLEQEGRTGYTEINAIAGELSQKVPSNWVWDAAKVLEARGLANCEFFVGGVCIAELSGEGRLFVEEGGSRIIQEYKSDPAQFVIATGRDNQVVVAGGKATATQSRTIAEERKPAFDLIQQIEELLEQDDSMSPEEKRDLGSDLEGVKGQLSKRAPNRDALASLLNGLSQVRSVAGSVAELVKLLNP